ncbi:unnamed protein product, partial [Ectocarpus sp. 12 AP-2014]
CSQEGLPFTVGRPFVLTACIVKTAQRSFGPDRDAEAKWEIMMALRGGWWPAQPLKSAAGDTLVARLTL